MTALENLARLIIAFACNYLLVSTLFVLIVLGAKRFLSHAATDVAWKTVLVGPVVIALSLTIMPPPAGAGRVSLPASESVFMQPVHATDDAVLPDTTSVFGSESAATPTSRADMTVSWPLVLFFLWALTSAGFLMRYRQQWRRFLHQIGRRETVTVGMKDRLLAGIIAKPETSPTVLTAAPGAVSPCAIGAVEICLPERLLAREEIADLRGAVAHEAAHLRRKDPYWLIAWRVSESLFFFQPLLRLARCRHMETVEYLCDAWAVQRLGTPIALVRSLVSAAKEAVGGELRLAPGMAVRKRVLLDRVRAVLDGSVRIPRPATLAFFTACAVMLVVLTPAISPAFGFFAQQETPKAVKAKPVKPAKQSRPAKSPKPEAAAASVPAGLPLPSRPERTPEVARVPVAGNAPVATAIVPEYPTPVARETPAAVETPVAARRVTAVSPDGSGRNLTFEEAEAILLNGMTEEQLKKERLRTPAPVARPEPAPAPRYVPNRVSFLVQYRPLIHSLLADDFESRTNALPKNDDGKGLWRGNIHEINDDESEYAIDFAKLRITDDQTAVRSIGMEGMIHIEVHTDGIRQSIDIKPLPNGRFQRTYTLNGERRSFGAAERAAFIKALDAVLLNQ